MMIDQKKRDEMLRKATIVLQKAERYGELVDSARTIDEADMDEGKEIVRLMKESAVPLATYTFTLVNEIDWLKTLIRHCVYALAEKDYDEALRVLGVDVLFVCESEDQQP